MMTQPNASLRTTDCVMVTGTSGRVGRMIAQVRGDQSVPMILSHRGTGRMMPGGEELRWDPLIGPQALYDWSLANGVPRALIVLAGCTPMTGTDMTINHKVAWASVEAARAIGVPRILLASSSAVYGHARAAPWRESDPVNPPTAYGQAKLLMERLCAGPDVCALRIGNVAGADALLTNTQRPLVIDRFATRQSPRRSYIGPLSLLRVFNILATTKLPLPPVLNVGTPRPVEMADLARAARIPFTPRDAGPDASDALVLETSLLETFVDFDDLEMSAPALVAQWRACRAEP